MPVLILLLFLATGCGNKAIQVEAPIVPVGLPEHEVAFDEGLRAFRLGTPEGYKSAAGSFRKAAELEQTRCEYALHWSESLYFLAQEQKENWEDFAPTVSEANTSLDLAGRASDCDNFESYTARLRTLRGIFAGTRTADSITAINRAIELDRDDPMNWIVLSQLRPALQVGQSLAPSQLATQLDPDLALGQYEVGNYLLSRPNASAFAQAKQAFERTLARSPLHFQAILGTVYSLSLNELEAARRTEPLLLRAVDIAPASLKVRLALGDHYAGLEETEKAIEQYKAASDRNPRYYPALLAAGIAFVTANRSDEAEKAFSAVIKLEVNKPHPPFNLADFGAAAQAHYYLGNIFLEREELRQARASFNAANENIVNYALAIYGLGIVSYKEGKLEEALKHLDRVIQIGPRQYPNAYLVRGGIRADRRQFPESLQDLNLAIEIYREQAVALEAKAKQDELNGFKRRADSQRRRKVLIEATLEKARETKKTVETLMGG